MNLLHICNYTFHTFIEPDVQHALAYKIYMNIFWVESHRLQYTRRSNNKKPVFSTELQQLKIIFRFVYFFFYYLFHTDCNSILNTHVYITDWTKKLLAHKITCFIPFEKPFRRQ